MVSSVMSYESLSYSSYTLGTYTYPYWANVTGWMISASSMIVVPIVAICQLIRFPGDAKQVRQLVHYCLLAIVVLLLCCYDTDDRPGNDKARRKGRSFSIFVVLFSVHASVVCNLFAWRSVLKIVCQVPVSN